MGAGPSECHHGTVYQPALRHAQDVSEVPQPPLSDRTQQVEHWRCSRVSIVLTSDDMQTSAVEAVDIAHHCSSQRPCIGRMRQCGAHCQLVSSQFQCPRQSVVGPDVRQWDKRRLCYRHAVKDIGFVGTTKTGVLPSNTRKSACSRGQYCYLTEPPQRVSWPSSLLCLLWSLDASVVPGRHHTKARREFPSPLTVEKVREQLLHTCFSTKEADVVTSASFVALTLVVGCICMDCSSSPWTPSLHHYHIYPAAIAVTLVVMVAASSSTRAASSAYSNLDISM